MNSRPLWEWGYACSSVRSARSIRFPSFRVGGPFFRYRRYSSTRWCGPRWLSLLPRSRNSFHACWRIGSVERSSGPCGRSGALSRITQADSAVGPPIATVAFTDARRERPRFVPSAIPIYTCYNGKPILVHTPKALLYLTPGMWVSHSLINGETSTTN